MDTLTNLGLHFTPSANGRQAPERVDRNDGMVSDIFNRLDIDNTPKAVAVVGLSAMAILFLLNKAGFRFVFGVNVGGK